MLIGAKSSRSWRGRAPRTEGKELKLRDRYSLPNALRRDRYTFARYLLNSNICVCTFFGPTLTPISWDQNGPFSFIFFEKKR